MDPQTRHYINEGSKQAREKKRKEKKKEKESELRTGSKKQKRKINNNISDHAARAAKAEQDKLLLEKIKEKRLRKKTLEYNLKMKKHALHGN